jgi:hypothetical protein
LSGFPSCSISPTDCQGVHLRSGKILNNQTTPIIFEEEEEVQNQVENQPTENQFTNISPSTSQITSPKKSNQLQTKDTLLPPYPERLNIDKTLVQSEFDFLRELKNVCVKIPLFQAIRDVPIYAKTVRELCLKRLGRKRKDPPTMSK